MSYIGASPTSAAFLTNSFSGDGTTTSFTLTVAPASSSSILVAVSGVLQDPATYAVVGTSLNFTGAPPSGTANIIVRFLGIPASNVATAAYRTVTEFTATAAQTTFSVPSYTPGFIDVYRNGVMLGSADYTATNGTTVVLATGATAGDLVEVISFYVSSIYNAISNTAGSVNANNIADGAVGTAELASGAVDLTTKVTGVLPQANGGTGTTTGYYGFKNRIINGDMTIDQRNNGASAVFTTSYVTVDRWRPSSNNITSAMTLQQNAGSVTPPTGFTNYLGLTVTTAQASLNADSAVRMLQFIEGFNTSDLAFGTASASPVTLSFWVRSSITGLYGAYLKNSDFNRAYVASYNINSANTWEYKTITFPGDTAGTWLTNNGVGIRVGFTLATGTSFQTTPGSWTASDVEAPTGQANLTSTVGATWYVTGVQLEKGSVATSFDYLPYTTKFSLCERYFRISRETTGGSSGGSGNLAAFRIDFTGMRTQPTMTVRDSTNIMEAMYINRYSISSLINTWEPTTNDVGLELSPTVNFPTQFPISLFSSALNLNSEL